MPDPDKTQEQFVPPKHENAETHARVMDRLRLMSKTELVQTLIDAGICSSSGQLTEHYREEK